MSKADKMFLELGYEKIEYMNGCEFMLKEHNLSVKFDYYDGKFIGIEKTNKVFGVSMLVAVYEKMKELGFVDER